MQKYDYNELINELRDEVGTGSLTSDEIIQVVRDSIKDKTGYQLIIDWYYNHEAMTIELSPDDSNSKEEKKDKLLLREQYHEDKDSLEAITVEACLSEITSRNMDKKQKNRNPFF